MKKKSNIWQGAAFCGCSTVIFSLKTSVDLIFFMSKAIFSSSIEWLKNYMESIK